MEDPKRVVRKKLSASGKWLSKNAVFSSRRTPKNFPARADRARQIVCYTQSLITHFSTLNDPQSNTYGPGMIAQNTKLGTKNMVCGQKWYSDGKIFGTVGAIKKLVFSLVCRASIFNLVSFFLLKKCTKKDTSDCSIPTYTQCFTC